MRAPVTYLFVPGNRPERYDKAVAAGADVIIIDLEDAVPATEKGAARAALLEWRPAPSTSLCVRVNATDSSEYGEDLACVARLAHCALMIPKASSPGALAAVAARFPGRPLIPLIETARGVTQAERLAHVPGVARFAFGALDLASQTGIAPDYDTMACARSRLAMSSVLAGLLPPIDGVTAAIDDAAALREDVRQALRYGFRAKLCIHPKQVLVVREAFAPREAELAWARRVMAANEASAGAAARVDGCMVDAPVVARAQQIIDMAEAMQPSASLKP